ncbi:hypothetical protein GP475_08150 [Corynebacterium poyangense]|uniref:Uncharacterized protein n=1 Tax=Corynebacterium poyangense TaxID=2684405 RepID=A0A7H0SPZ0_9CORY|nr:galactokinase family protein [Corynebacterium poyangense]MBZ8178459.1 hypothetical protein [Corynebacterium poyangense]QNQ90615.1 hypothetical protein GP475_08150 [Corynebacterium poyangense]
MPQWNNTEFQGEDLPCKLAATHHEIFHQRPQLVAQAPGSWPLIGEHTDYFGGIALYGLVNRNLYLALTPNKKSTIDLRILDSESFEACLERSGCVELNDFLSKTSSEEKSPHTYAQNSSDVVRLLAATTSALMQRQLLSRHHLGWDITVVTNIPRDIGLGEETALQAAFALALLSHNHQVDVPTRARLSELGAQASELIHPGLATKSRLTAVLRGADSGFCAVDHADGAVTRSPGIDSSRYHTLGIYPHAHHTQASVVENQVDAQQIAHDLEQRKALCENAAHGFGVGLLRLLPQATTRVPEWLRAYHQVHDDSSQPAVSDAEKWLNFWEAEIQRAKDITNALHSHRYAEVWAVINQSRHDITAHYGLNGPEDALCSLALQQGALSARPLVAGIHSSAVAFVERNHSQDFCTHLHNVGIHTTDLPEGNPARVIPV